MTTLTYEANTIMAYVGATGDVVGVSGLCGMPVWAGNKTYFLQTSAAGPGLRQFDIDPDGQETLQVGKATLGLTDIDVTNGGAGCITPDGQSIIIIGDNNNSCQLAKINASDLTLDDTFGTVSSSTSASTSTRILTPHMMVATNTNLICASSSNTQEIDSVLISGFGPNTNAGVLSSAPSAFGALLGPASGSNDAFIIGLPFSNGGAGDHTLPIVLYRITSGGSLVSIGSVDPSDIDATWTHITVVRGVAFDTTDGNVLIGVSTTDSVTTKQYIVKLNTSSAAVMWTSAITGLTAYSWSFTFARIENSMFHYADSSSLIRHIDTTDGTQTTETFTGLSVLGPQFSDDVTNSIIGYGAFNAGANPPNYVGEYMGTLAHHNVTAWLRFWFVTEPEAPPPDVSTLGVSFADFTNEDFLDWDNDAQGVDYDSFLITFYVQPEDSMFWMYSPYVYTFFATETGAFVVDSTGASVVNSMGSLIVSSLQPSCFMSAKWDWVLITDDTAPKETAYQQVYRIIDDKIVTVTKKKIRGKGRTVQLKYKSQSGRDFQLLGWGLVLNKLTET